MMNQSSGTGSPYGTKQIARTGCNFDLSERTPRSDLFPIIGRDGTTYRHLLHVFVIVILVFFFRNLLWLFDIEAFVGLVPV